MSMYLTEIKFNVTIITVYIILIIRMGEYV